ncbi:MAG: four-carbon acid sugar kinase family protein [Candidatus Gastranaerophilales bacterium]|nr:four-carbon acid sugar kinase family protein [Candidatus Gastranaerophilales bacterium]
MFIQTGTIGIIADDLTGANDTALQFHLSGANTQILFDYAEQPEGLLKTQVWAISTETRNLKKEAAIPVIENAVKILTEKLNTEYFYKKIDSTLRGNIASECMTVLKALGWDCAVVVPAFPSEGRTTVGGYHLLHGVPLDRTEFARDPKSPVRESYIPTILRQQIENPDLVALIPLKTVTKGAGPILTELQRLIDEGRKLIVIDAVSTTDIQQIVLATEKSTYNILPCGTAAMAQCFSDVWLPETEYQHINKTIPDNPVLIVSGSSTTLTKIQIAKVIESEEFEPYIVELSLEDINNNSYDEILSRILNNLIKYRLVVVHFSAIEHIEEQNTQYAQEHGINPEDVPGMITDYLARLTKDVVVFQDVILVLVGGETSYKCCRAIDSTTLQVIDEADIAIPLCLDFKAQWIVTKSGNLGNSSTLINVLKYFERHK